MKKNMFLLIFFLTIGIFANAKNLYSKKSSTKKVYKSEIKTFYKLYPVSYTNFCGLNTTVTTTYYFTTEEAASNFKQKHQTINVTCP